MMQEEAPFLNWSAECDDITLDYFHMCKSTLLSNQDKIAQKLYFLLSQLVTSCQRATEGSVSLVRSCYLWEAEVLIRSVVEGTVKYIYLCIEDEDKRTNKVAEYWDDLPNLYQIKQHSKAAEWLSQAGNTKEQRWKPLRDLILDPEELALLKSKYP